MFHMEAIIANERRSVLGESFLSIPGSNPQLWFGRSCFPCLQGADLCLSHCSPWHCTGCPRASWDSPTTSCCALPPSAGCAAFQGPNPTRILLTGTSWLAWLPNTALRNNTTELQEELFQEWSSAVLVRYTYLLYIYFPNKTLAGHKGLVSKKCVFTGKLCFKGGCFAVAIVQKSRFVSWIIVRNWACESEIRLWLIYSASFLLQVLKVKRFGVLLLKLSGINYLLQLFKRFQATTVM